MKEAPQKATGSSSSAPQGDPQTTKGNEGVRGTVVGDGVFSKMDLGMVTNGVPTLTPAMKATELKLLRTQFVKGRLGKGGKTAKLNGIMHAVTEFTIMAGPVVLTTTSGGVLQFQFGWNTLIGSSDYGNLLALFEVVRVKKMVWSQEPIAQGQFGVAAPTSTQLPIHVPEFLSFDPNTSAAVSFASLLASRPLDDTRSLYTHTGKSVRKAWRTEEKALGPATGSTALVPTIGQWNDTSSTTPTGGMLVALNTAIVNVSVSLAVASLQYVCEFAYRI